jgi:GMP synthase (glutamine-hydrolysing)
MIGRLPKRRVLVIQHIACEPPAAYEDELVERGIALERVEIDQGQPLPDWRDFEAIVAMGGPMSVNDDHRLPWLSEEKRVIGEAVRAGLPYWGVCLGAQLLAASLGAAVYQGDAPEVGMHDVVLTDSAAEDPVFAHAPAAFTTLQWHSDTFELPEGSVLLASSPAYPHQAFTWKRAYGLQFHLEVSSELAAEWGEVPAYATALDQILGPGALDRLVEDVAQVERPMGGLARMLFGRWLDGVVEAALSFTADGSRRSSAM